MVAQTLTDGRQILDNEDIELLELLGRANA